MARQRITRKNSEKVGCETIYVSKDECCATAFYSYKRPIKAGSTWVMPGEEDAFRPFLPELYKMFGIEEICDGEMVEINLTYMKRLYNAENKLQIIPPRI